MYTPITDPRDFGEGSIGKTPDAWSRVLEIFLLQGATPDEVAAQVERLERDFLAGRAGKLQQSQFAELRKTVGNGGSVAINQVFDRLRQLVVNARSAVKKPVAASDKERTMNTRITMREVARQVAEQRQCTIAQAQVIVDEAMRGGNSDRMVNYGGKPSTISLRDIVRTVAKARGCTLGQAQLLVEEARARGERHSATPNWPHCA
jgi:hypothetical protein